MHYLGMAGMRLNGKLEYNTLTVAASVVIAVVAATAALWAAGQVRGFLWSVGASLVMGLAVSGMHYTGMAALSVHLHGAAALRGRLARRPARPMMIGPLVFLLLAGVVVMFDPLMVMGKPDWTPTEQRPGVPAHPAVPHTGRRPASRTGERLATAVPAPRSAADRTPLSVGGRTVDSMRPVSKIERTVAPFEVVSPYQPSGDQPAAIAELDRRIRAGEKDVVLLGATGTGKSATTAWMIEKLQRPTLVMAPNKTLAAQLANEFRELLPNNAVEYFVSYYDYYQPEAYVPQSDTYIEKDSSINEEVERLRHSATNSLLTRRDVVVVASVSCIYGLGTPQEYVDRMVPLKVGDEIDRDQLLRRFVDIQYTRNDLAFTRGTFRVRGDTIEIFPVYEELAVRIEMFGDEIEALSTLHPLTGEVISDDQQLYVFPATHYVAGPERMERAVNDIEKELGERLAELEKQGKLLEAQRLRMRTTYDIEMLRQIGSCSGVENYSMHFDGREPGSAAEHPPRLLPGGLPARHRRVARHRAADRRDVRGRRLPQAHPRRPRLPAALRPGQPPAEVGGVPGADRPDRLSVGDPGQVRALARRRLRRADHPPHRPRSTPRSSSSPPRARSTTWCTRSASAPRRTSASWSPRSPRRWPRTSPTTSWNSASRCATCTATSTPCAASSCCASCAPASTTSWSASTCCVRASTCPRCPWWRSSTPTRRASCAPAPR